MPAHGGGMGGGAAPAFPIANDAARQVFRRSDEAFPASDEPRAFGRARTERPLSPTWAPHQPHAGSSIRAMSGSEMAGRRRALRHAVASSTGVLTRLTEPRDLISRPSSRDYIFIRNRLCSFASRPPTSGERT